MIALVPARGPIAQFSPYLFFGCSLKSQFNGTLFRFPLRMAAAARDSEISQASYSAESVMELLNQFKEAATRCVSVCICLSIFLSVSFFFFQEAQESKMKSLVP